VSRAILVLLPLVLPGCMPSFSGLVAHRRYADALCHVRSASEAEALVTAVERDTELRVHVHTVREEELEKSLGKQGKAISEKVTLARAYSFASKIPLSGSTSVSLQFGEHRAQNLSGSLYPSDEQAAVLFALTGETRPGSSTAVDVNALTREVIWGVLTIGLKQLLFGSRKLTHTVGPGRADFLRKGPGAMALFDGLNSPAGAQAFLLPAQRESPVDLALSYSSVETDEDFHSCSLYLTYTVRLVESGRPLWQATEQAFGAKAPRVTELGARRTFTVSNHRGSWSSR
jgi:hypothetical protein